MRRGIISKKILGSDSMKNDLLKNLSKFIGSGCTPSRKNSSYWNSKDFFWLKTEQLGEYKIQKTSEFISQKAVDECNLKIYPQNTISVAMYGEGKTRGNVSLIDSPMATNQACCNIEIDSKKIDYGYVYYYLKNQYETLRRLSAGVRKNLNSDDIKNFPIIYPEDKSLQKKISSVLFSLDEKISLNKKINATLEDMAKTIYDYYFVQFDFPDENGKPYKSSGGKMIFSPELQREIPEGWQVGNLNLIADIIAGGDRPDEISNFKTKEFSIPIYSNSTEKQGLYGFSKNSSIKKDSITIAARGNIGYAVLRKKNFLPIIRLIVITPNENIYLEYIYHFFKNYSYRKNGSVQQQLTVPQVKEINLVIPPTNILRKYHNFVDSNIKKQFQILEENNLLENLRDFLLPLLMNGQVSFKEE